MTLAEKDFTFVTPEALADVRGGNTEAIRDSWWAMRGEEIAFFRGRYPQCNRDRRVTERLTVTYPWCTEIRQIPCVFISYQAWYRDGEPERRYTFPKAVAS